jgi:hypothetical protein
MHPVFQGSDVIPLAFWISKGSIRRPLRIETYYLTAAERETVEAAVRSFLSEQTNNQAVIQFFEAERYEITAGGAMKTLPSVLLAEVWINCEPPVTAG